MKIEPLNTVYKNTNELKELIKKHPTYPIVVLVNSEVVADDGYNWWFAPSVYYSIGEILDCVEPLDNKGVFYDRADFEEEVEKYIDLNLDIETDEQFDEKKDEIMKEYEPLWKKVIFIRADV